MDRYAIVCTHHKAGTVWMNHTFRKIGGALDIPVVNIGRAGDASPKTQKPPAILCATHSKLGKFTTLFDNPEAGIFHLIRDPRDIVISSMHYHRKSDEKWLHRAEDKFDGATYHDALNHLKTDRERYVFECDNSSRTNIGHIAKWDYKLSNGFECKYEDLIQDYSTALFGQIAEHLGFSESEVAQCRKLFWKNAIFGGKDDGNVNTNHVRSGEARQWEGIFDRALGRAVAERFGKTLIKLGYETDDSWIDRLPALRPELDAVMG